MSIQQIIAILKSRIRLLILLPIIAVITTILITSLSPRLYTANSTVLIDIQRSPERQASGELAPVPAGLAESYLATQVGIIASHPVALKAVEKLGLASLPEWRETFEESTDGVTAFADWAADKLSGNLSIEPQKNTRLINILYTGDDPVFTAKVANAFAEAYQETTRDMLSNPAQETRRSIANTLETLRQELEQAQADLSSFQQRTGIFATDERLDIETTRLNELNQQVLEAESAARLARSRAEILDKLLASGDALDTIPQVVESHSVQTLKQELGKKEAELAQLAAQLGPQHPTRKTAAAEVESLRRALRNEMRTIAEGIRNEAVLAQNQVANVKAAEEQQRENVLKLKVARDALPPLLQKVATAGDNYNRALEAYSQYNMQISLSQTDVAIFSQARPPTTPSGPNMMMNVALALVMGGFLGILAAFLLEFVNPRVLTREELEQFPNFPYPREIPKAST